MIHPLIDRCPESDEKHIPVISLNEEDNRIFCKVCGKVLDPVEDVSSFPSLFSKNEFSYFGKKSARPFVSL